MSKVSRSLLIYRNKNAIVPAAYLEKAIKAYPHWCGVTFLSDGELVIDRSAKQASITGINELQENEQYKGCDMLFTLGKEEGKPALDEKSTCLQPFTIISEGEGDDEVEKVLAFVDGDFTEFAENESPEGRPYLFVHQYLIPKFKDVWELVGGNIDKFAGHLRKKHVETEILAAAMANGDKTASIAILTTAAEKGFMGYVVTDKSEDFRWGFVTDTLDYTEDTDGDGDGTGDDDGSTGTTTGKGGDTTATSMFRGRPPANVIENKALRAQYLKFHGNANPSGWKNRAPHSILPGMVEEARKAGWEIIQPIASVEPAKSTAAASVPGVNAKEKGIAFVKAIDVSTLIAMTPEEMAKNEKERPTFFEQTGAKPEDVVNWSPATLGKLYDTDKDMTITFMRDLQYIVHRLNADLDEATKGEPEVKIEPVKPPRARVSISR